MTASLLSSLVVSQVLNEPKLKSTYKTHMLWMKYIWYFMSWIMNMQDAQMNIISILQSKLGMTLLLWKQTICKYRYLLNCKFTFRCITALIARHRGETGHSYTNQLKKEEYDMITNWYSEDVALLYPYVLLWKFKR